MHQSAKKIENRENPENRDFKKPVSGFKNGNGNPGTRLTALLFTHDGEITDKA